MYSDDVVLEVSVVCAPFRVGVGRALIGRSKFCSGTLLPVEGRIPHFERISFEKSLGDWGRGIHWISCGEVAPGSEL